MSLPDFRRYTVTEKIVISRDSVVALPHLSNTTIRECKNTEIAYSKLHLSGCYSQPRAYCEHVRTIQVRFRMRFINLESRHLAVMP